VTTDANGAFAKKVPMDLGEHPTLESTVWKSDGSALVVAAHTRFTAPPQAAVVTSDGSALVVAAHPRFTAPCKPEDTLSFTGSHTPLLGGLGLALLITGGILVRGAGRAPPPAPAGPTTPR